MKIDEKLLFKIGSKIDIAGSSGSGKTWWLHKYLTEVDSRYDQIVWITNELSSEQDIVKDLQKTLKDKFKLVIGLNENEDMLKDLFYDNKDDKILTAVVIDDLMLDSSKFLGELFIAGRHMNITIYNISQSLFCPGKYGRTCALNSQYNVWFSFPDQLSVCEKARRMSTNIRDKDLIVEAYKQCIKTRGGCLIVDTISAQSDLKESNLLRFRNTKMNIVFPELANI
jgi:hypothetical protein